VFSKLSIQESAAVLCVCSSTVQNRGLQGRGCWQCPPQAIQPKFNKCL